MFMCLKSLSIFTTTILFTFINAQTNEKQNEMKCTDGEVCPNLTVLKTVYAIFRHGDSSPKLHVPMFAEVIEKYAPEGRDQLTDVGILQSFDLGVWLRNRYPNLIPDYYNSSYLFARSSQTDKAAMSAISMLAGFYNNSKSPLKAVGVNWQPIPMHVIRKDFVLCPHLQMVLNSIYESEESKSFEMQHKQLFDLLTRELQIGEINWKNSWEVYELMNWMESRKIELPSWYTPNIKNELKEVELFILNAMLSSSELLRLETGLYLSEFLENMKTSLDSSNLEPQMDVTFSSDNNLLAILMEVIGVRKTELIPFGSCFMIELRKVPNATNYEQLFVKVIYKSGSMMSEAENLTLPGCKDQMTENGCPLNVMMKILEPYLLSPEMFLNLCSQN